MVILCVFPPGMLLMSGIGFGPSPLSTILVASAVGGTLTAVLMGWPKHRLLASVCGLVSGIGAQALLFAAIYWLDAGRLPKVFVVAMRAVGAAPGYLMFRWLTRATRGTDPGVR
jgi:hypothetical protein